jgi:hypothetical protein
MTKLEIKHKLLLLGGYKYQRVCAVGNYFLSQSIIFNVQQIAD